jgi:hypothetical protein
MSSKSTKYTDLLCIAFARASHFNRIASLLVVRIDCPQKHRIQQFPDDIAMEVYAFSRMQIGGASIEIILN